MEKNTVNDNILNDTIFGITFNFASIDNIFSPKKNKVLKKNAVNQKKYRQRDFGNALRTTLRINLLLATFSTTAFLMTTIFFQWISENTVNAKNSLKKYRQCQFHVQMSKNTVNAQVQSYFVVQDVLTVSILSYLAPLEPFSPGNLTAFRIYSGRTLKKLITCNNVSNLLLVAHLLLPAFQY